MNGPVPAIVGYEQRMIALSSLVELSSRAHRVQQSPQAQCAFPRMRALASQAFVGVVELLRRLLVRAVSQSHYAGQA